MDKGANRVSYDRMMEALSIFTSNSNPEEVSSGGSEGAEKMMLGGTLLRDVIMGTIKRYYIVSISRFFIIPSNNKIQQRLQTRGVSTS